MSIINNIPVVNADEVLAANFPVVPVRIKAIDVPVTVTSAPESFVASSTVVVAAASAVLVPAELVKTNRTLRIQVLPSTPAGVFQRTGIHINFGAAATDANAYIPPGEEFRADTLQEIRAIRGAAALDDVSVTLIYE